MLSRKLWIVAITGLLLLGVAWIGGAASGRVEIASAAPLDAPAASTVEQPNLNGAFMWSYSVKFVCGVQIPHLTDLQAVGEPPVKPGNYATEINIHNYQYREAKVGKKLLVLFDKNEAIGREPKTVEPSKYENIVLRPDAATMDDCYHLWEVLRGIVPPVPAPLMIGYLVILSPVDLDIDAVYTAEVGNTSADGTLLVSLTGNAMDVERIPGKRVFVPNDVLKLLFPS